jgi:trehalose-phosphatase
MRASGTATRRKKRRVRKTRKVVDLFDCWADVAQRLRAAKEIRLFMDFDGTLAPHTPYPDSVRLSNEMKSVLRRIARHPRVHVGIVSGRRKATLQRLVRVPRIAFYGLYGWENGVGFDVSRATAFHLREILDAIEEQSAELPGVQAEDKGASVAVHFRDAPRASQRAASNLIRGAVSRTKGDLRVLETESAWDIVPSHVRGKGIALRGVLADVHRPYLPIYVGDDISDEPALAEVRRGITIRVGTTRRTVARYRLRDSKMVYEFLIRLEKELP